MRKTMLSVGVLGGIAAGLAGLGVMQEGEGRGQPDLGAMLIEGLMNTEGCLGADAAQTRSGKNCIFAWFKDKKAVQDWYYSQAHRRIMGPMVNGIEDFEPKPLQFVPDDTGPIMVIATITMGGDDPIPGFPMPISQISIELFQPLPGGVEINGRFSPEGFKIEHMKSYTPEE